MSQMWPHAAVVVADAAEQLSLVLVLRCAHDACNAALSYGLSYGFEVTVRILLLSSSLTQRHDHTVSYSAEVCLPDAPTLAAFPPCQEFWLQGDLAKERGLDFGPLYDRHSASIPACQGPFAAEAAMSLLELLRPIAPEGAGRALSHLQRNIHHWDLLANYEAKASQLVRCLSELQDRPAAGLDGLQELEAL